jgi:hypothetical protein
VLGTDNALLHQLALTALGTTASLAVAVTVIYPMASARFLTAAIEGTTAAAGRGHGGRLADAAIRVLVRAPAARASAQMLLATAARVSTHRFVVAIGAGLTAAVIVPIAAAVSRAAPSAVPTVPVLAAPLIAIAFSLVTLRLVVSFPSEVGGAWLVATIGPANRHTKTGVRRMMIVLGVLPAVLAVAVVFTGRWNASMGSLHAALCLAVGLILTEALLHQLDGMPCVRRWHPEGANLRMWWPLYLFAFLVVARGVPSLTLAIYPGTRTAFAWIAGVTVAATTLLRWRGARASPLFEPDDNPVDVSFT